MTGTTTRRREWWFVALSAVVLLCAGGVGGWLIATPARPDALAAPILVTEVPLSAEDFDDARTVTISVAATGGVDLLAQIDGVVTSFDCEPGDVWKSGTSPIGVDGQPLLALATSVPLWRDLHEGDRGGDVAALQSELYRLGVDTATDGRLSAPSSAAFARFLAGKGIAVVEGVMRRADVVWLPDRQVTIGSCPVHVGQQIAAGGAIANAAPGLAALRVDPMPSDLAAGARTLTVGSTTVSLDGSGSVTNPDDLAKLAGERQVQDALTNPGQLMSARLALATPITVYPLPPGAVSGLGADACVRTGTGPVAAVIVSSTLGRTLVSFPAGGAPARAVVDPARPAACA
jgi:hypothetical protein